MRDEKNRRPPQEAEADGLIEGRNAVIEALRAGTAIDKIYIARGETDATLGHIASTARGKGIVVTEADRRKLDGMSRTKSHQGVIAVAATFWPPPGKRGRLPSLWCATSSATPTTWGRSSAPPTPPGPTG